MGKCAIEQGQKENFRFYIITYIDANYTLGKIEDAKKNALKRLQDEKVITVVDGVVYSHNKQLKLPIVIQRIAVITSKGIEGENDFITKLVKNKRGYYFSLPFREELYVPMQGKAASEGIMEKLNYLETKTEDVDIIVIVRGGGDASNFDCFNDYDLCKAVANFPIPIITGIGHEINLNIIDLVANVSAIVPAEAAEKIIEHNTVFEDRIDEIGRDISVFSKDFMNSERQKLSEQEGNLKREINYVISGEKKTLSEQETSLKRVVNYFLSGEKQTLNQYADRIINLNPEKVLARGYAILSANGRVLSNTKGLKSGDNLKAILKNNTIETEIIKIEKRDENQFDL